MRLKNIATAIGLAASVLLLSATPQGGVTTTPAGSCWRLGSVLCCTALGARSGGSITCTDEDGQSWNCEVPPADKDEAVTWCLQVTAGEFGRTECKNDSGTSDSECSYTEVTCGFTFGTCLSTYHQESCKQKELDGQSCIGPRQVGGQPH